MTTPSLHRQRTLRARRAYRASSSGWKVVAALSLANAALGALAVLVASGAAR